jgi:hypothetical protein
MNPRHVDDEVMDEPAQHSHQRIDGIRRKADLVAERLLRAQNEEALAVNRHRAFEKDRVDA